MSVYVAPRRAQPLAGFKAGPLGPGAGVLQTEFPLSLLGRQTPQERMKRYWALGAEVGWVNRAESAIGERFSGVDWHLEDENDDEITDQTPDADLVAALNLTEKPAAQLGGQTQPYFRSDLWQLTSRAMGLCGSGFMILGGLEALGGTPSVVLPIAPWRMFPDEDNNGNVTGWHADKTQTSEGTPLSIEQVLHFRLQRDYTSHFGIGLVASAMTKMANSSALDNHLAMLLSAGGRLSGVMSPKTGIIEAETMSQMERDWRSIVEQNDAAKRLQLIRAPIDFTATTLSPRELQIKDLMVMSRDELLTEWNVPLSIVGGTPPTGLNSGDSRKYDEAAIWQGPVHSRLTIFREVMQFQLYDRWASLGHPVEFIIEEPEFDDDSPRYDLLLKSQGVALTNAERRALIGKDPIGDPAIDNAIVLPALIVPYAVAPVDSSAATASEDVLGRAVQESTPETTAATSPASAPAMAAAGEVAQPSATSAPAKAAPIRRFDGMHRSLVAVRSHAERSFTPRLRDNVGQVLRSQAREIAGKIRQHAAHIAANPKDQSIWWRAGHWDTALQAALAGPLVGMAQAVNDTIAASLPAQKAAPVGAVERVLTRGAARVTRINEHTRDRVQELISTTLENNASMLELADAIESEALFDEARSEVIARTELMDAYNASALGSYSDAGIEMVEAIDGDEDEECINRVANNPYTIDDADAEEDHPNGTLDWVPYIEGVDLGEQPAPEEGDTGEGKAGPLQLVRHDWRDAMKAAIDAAPPTVVVNVPAPIINFTPPTVEAPVVVVNNPENPPADVHVHVDAAQVNVPEQAAPIVVVQPTPAPDRHTPRTKRVKKENDGSYSITED